MGIIPNTIVYNTAMSSLGKLLLGFVSGSDLVEASCRRVSTGQTSVLPSVGAQLAQERHRSSHACLKRFMSLHKPHNALHPVYEPLGSKLSQNHTHDSLMIAGVWHYTVVVCSKGVVAGPGGTKDVAPHLHILLAAALQLLADVIGRQRGKGTAQRMPCVQPTGRSVT
ncbi:MAG: hypothetical protein FRX49_01614 [Trebouxia sp. A1-2]|nr:MAG: hypothetical protein FRX49_01614 [Trebouxia sp. A1-2]